MTAQVTGHLHACLMHDLEMLVFNDQVTCLSTDTDTAHATGSLVDPQHL